MARQAKFTVGKDRSRWYVNLSASVSGTNKREKRFFDTKEKALAEAQRLRIEQHDLGAEAARLPPALREDAKRAADILEPHGASLIDAAEHYAAWRKELADSCTFDELVDSYLDRKKSMSDRERGTYGQLKTRYGQHFGDCVVAAITHEELEEAIDTYDLSAASFNTHRRYLSVLFNHEMQRIFGPRVR